MTVKRVSYFTFLVAITTIATVTSCNKVKAQALLDIAVSHSVELSDASTVYGPEFTFELSKVLRDKGLQTGKFKIATRHSGSGEAVTVYLIFDKDYKGPVSAKIFNTPFKEYVDAPVLTCQQAPPRYCNPVFDERAGIASRNRILLE
jgi:hypothetical protein